MTRLSKQEYRKLEMFDFKNKLNKVFAVYSTIFIVVSSSAHGQNAESDSLRISEYPPYETFLLGDIVKFGVQTGFIFTKDLDTGMDSGGRISHQFFHPYFKLTSQIHFWAASGKYIDMGVAGIEESITYQIPLRRNLASYAGFTVGYISILEEKQVFNGTDYEEIDTRTNYFEPFVIFGLEYIIDKRRSFFIEGKIGSTSLSKEVHLLIGLNFFSLNNSQEKK
ncbi:hypothetical protein ACFL60_04110 [Candidatus Omnitrophota bacterium]